MKADLYICSTTFSYNLTDSIDDIRKKVSDFNLMTEKIREYSEENSLYLNFNDFSSTIIFNDGKSINELIANYTNSTSKYGKDIITLIFSLFKYCQESNESLNTMKQCLEIYDKDSCNGLIVLNPLEGYEHNIQVISNIDDWYKLRRFLLAKYPIDEHFFIDETKKYFPSLQIHESTKSLLKDVLKNHSHRIVEYLSILNDFLIKEFNQIRNNDINNFLPLFALKYNIDDASLEGQKDNKFMRIFPDGTKAYCEPHLKMYKDDSGNNNQHCRIYFKKPNKGEKIVYIGCICQHL